jgi:uncharacterized protein YndB with AHSA1/START domain
VNETLHAVDGRLVLRFERRFGHPMEKVWRALTEPAQLAAWFPWDMELDLHEGGKILFVMQEGEGRTLDGSIIELDPPRVFTYTWGDDVLHWELRPDDGGCLLVFTHTFDERPSAASFAAGWTICLTGLRSVLAGEKPAEDALAEWPELHERYVDRFGLAEGTTRQTAEGWVVRFDRQMTRPVDEVWAALTGADSGMPDAGVAVGGPAPLRVTNGYVPVGTVTAVRPPTLLETEWRAGGQPAGRVRWELSEGNGGARLTLTQTGPADLADRRPTALAAWHTQLDLLADHLRGRTRPWPEGRTEELTRHYAAAGNQEARLAAPE